jgi:tRNA pseudouridine38-40 synthase
MSPAKPAADGRWLVRFGYDGASFDGWARQPGRRTIEEVLGSGLVRYHVAPSIQAARLSVASRTDRGVSAVGNVLALTSSWEGDALLHALNGIAPEIFFTHARQVPRSFRERGAVLREYRYFLGRPWEHPGQVAAAMRQLARPHLDVRSFGRDIPRDVPRWRPVESITQVNGRRPYVRVRAPAFVWGMVRKIIGALQEVDAGRLPMDRLESAVQGRGRLTLPTAEPEPLVLWSVQYAPSIHWTHTRARRGRRTRYWEPALRQAIAREAVMRAVTSAATPRPPDGVGSFHHSTEGFINSPS